MEKVEKEAWEKYDKQAINWMILLCGDTMKTFIDSQRISNQIIFKVTDFPNELNSLEHYPRSSKKTLLERF